MVYLVTVGSATRTSSTSFVASIRTGGVPSQIIVASLFISFLQSLGACRRPPLKQCVCYPVALQSFIVMLLPQPASEFPCVIVDPVVNHLTQGG